MIDILKQHARERRLTVYLYFAVTLILFLVQWRIGTLSADALPMKSL